MFCQRFIKILLVSLLGILLTSCKEETSFLGFSKVEVTTNLFNESPRLELFIFSTKDYHLLTIDHKYFEKVTYQKQNINLYIDGLIIEGYLHFFDIRLLKQELLLTNIDLKYQNKIYELDIGLYQSIYLEPSNVNIKSSCDVYDSKGIINYQNNLYKPIYIEEIKNLTSCKAHNVSIKSFPRSVIYSKQLKSIDIFTIDIKKKYHQIGGIIKTSFITNLEECYIYTTYYYSSNPINKGVVDVSNLEIVN